MIEGSKRIILHLINSSQHFWDGFFGLLCLSLISTNPTITLRDGFFLQAIGVIGFVLSRCLWAGRYCRRYSMHLHTNNQNSYPHLSCWWIFSPPLDPQPLPPQSTYVFLVWYPTLDHLFRRFLAAFTICNILLVLLGIRFGFSDFSSTSTTFKPFK